ncbi:uncharacterized protein LOC118741940 [Rhagoletis pomonella]|uniref:uncharacterized protein LOC118741940 n=1 Tax=Rhagoletis pomonella TaxID=28610 RepID=UPI00178298F9|nr:uncharacterized protein LOC118741940 [Rhagoletis pomonella]
MLQGIDALPSVQQDDEIFHITIINLDERLYDQAYDVITNPPTFEKFKTLKETIVAKFSSSSVARLEQLVSGIQLGDNKPSHMLTQLQRTNVTRDQQIIKDFWLQRLPTAARAVVAGVAKSSPMMSVEDLALVADEINDNIKKNEVVAVDFQSTSSNISAIRDNSKSLSERISKIENSISRLENSFKRKFASNQAQSYTRGISNSFSKEDESKVCWYHAKFGGNATRCKTPCSFSSKN